MLDREIDEVGVDEHVVGRAKLSVVGEEKPNFLLLELLDADVIQQ